MNIKRTFLYTAASLLRFIPDEWILPIQYRIKTGRLLHLKEPERFTEKIQHYKAYYHNPVMRQCVDKYAVREYVVKKLGTAQYLNTLYQLCQKPEEIDFQSLPNQFVIKTTDGGSGDNTLICKDKQALDISKAIETVRLWTKKKYAVISREWAYGFDEGSRIIVEQYLEDDRNADGSLEDYKFLCFNGKFKYLWIDRNRYSNHTRCFYDEQLNWLHWISSDHPAYKDPFELPTNIKEMIPLAERLAEDFPFARIDFYNIKGRIIFGEITFYPMSGYFSFEPDSFDFDLGHLFDIDHYGQYDERTAP